MTYDCAEWRAVLGGCRMRPPCGRCAAHICEPLCRTHARLTIAGFLSLSQTHMRAYRLQTRACNNITPQHAPQHASHTTSHHNTFASLKAGRLRSPSGKVNSHAPLLARSSPSPIQPVATRARPLRPACSCIRSSAVSALGRTFPVVPSAHGPARRSRHHNGRAQAIHLRYRQPVSPHASRGYHVGITWVSPARQPTRVTRGQPRSGASGAGSTRPSPSRPRCFLSEPTRLAVEGHGRPAVLLGVVHQPQRPLRQLRARQQRAHRHNERIARVASHGRRLLLHLAVL
jgi:hypothetical protein